VSLMFATGKDRNLELLTQGLTPKRLAPVYGQVVYLSASSSTSGGACSGPYHRVTKTTQGNPIGAPIFQPSIGTSSSFTLVASPG
jgi:hypothetical protein